MADEGYFSIFKDASVLSQPSPSRVESNLPLLDPVDVNTPSSSAKQVTKCEDAFCVDSLVRLLGVDDSYYILGIDEAGRGPVIGPMVYSGAAIQIAEHRALVSCGVADSKKISEANRNTSLLQMTSSLKTFSAWSRILSAETISNEMLGRRGRTLNTLSHETAMKIITEATLALKGKLCAVYVDTVGLPEAYYSKLHGRFPHLHIVVKSKADSLFPVVSAASIVAKTTRDAEVRKINESINARLQKAAGSELAGDVDDHIGCGYPSDPRAMNYVRSRVHRFFVHSLEDSFVRASWAPVIQLASSEDSCVPVLFEEDYQRLKAMNKLDEIKKFKYEEPLSAAQPKLSFVAPPPSRHCIFTALKMPTYLSSLTSMMDRQEIPNRKRQRS